MWSLKAFQKKGAIIISNAIKIIMVMSFGGVLEVLGVLLIRIILFF